MDRIYVVMGERGEYSDWTTWTVRAFDNHDDALAFAEACRAHVKTLPIRPSWDYRNPSTKAAYDAAMPTYCAALLEWQAASPDASMTDRDTIYSINEIPFGNESTALNTAPAHVRNRDRNYDLTHELEP
jgi:hypothetical protein